MADSGDDGEVRTPTKSLFRNAELERIAVALAIISEDWLKSVLSTCVWTAEQLKGKYKHLATNLSDCGLQKGSSPS